MTSLAATAPARVRYRDVHCVFAAKALQWPVFGVDPIITFAVSNASSYYNV